MSNDKQKVSRSTQRADAMQRAARAWHLRVTGSTWEQIAAEVGYASAPGAHRAVTRFAGTLPDPKPEELRNLWRARMEQLWVYAQRDAEDSRPGALRAGVAIADRASKLDGLDAPSRVSMEVDGDRLDALVGELLRRSGSEEIVDADVIEIGEIED